MDWVDEEAEKIRNAKAASRDDAERRKSIALQSPGLWSDFRYLIEQEVIKINNTPDIRSKIGYVRFIGANINFVVVDSDAFPSVCLTITDQSLVFRVERVIRTNSGLPEPNEKKESETLRLDLDGQGRVIIKTEQGRSLDVHGAVKYALTPVVQKHEIYGV